MTNLEEYNEHRLSSPNFLKDSPVGNLILLTLLAIAGVFLLSLFTIILGLVTGIDMADLMQGNIQEGDSAAWWIIRILLILNTVIIFLLPAILYNYITSKSFLQNLGVEAKVSNYFWGWSIILFAVSLPVVTASAWLNQQVPLPEWAKLSEDKVNDIITYLLGDKSILSLIINLIVMALLPAIGEEWFFRGSLQRTLIRLLRNNTFAVIASAFIFSLLHFQLEGFIPRFILGLVLGLIFLKTGNLWVTILLHFTFNGVQVISAYALSDKLEKFNTEKIQEPNWFITAACLGLAIYICIKAPKKETISDEREI